MITVNKPFESLEPLTTYLGSLEQVTENPAEDTIADLIIADKILTDKAVLYPVQEFVHREGYRTFGYKPCSVSSGVHDLARLALHEPGSEAYHTEYRKIWSTKAEVELDAATPENRRNSARVALIGLGRKLAVSGAFYQREIRPAYEAIVQTLNSIGSNDEEDFAAFGKHRIGADLLREYTYLLRGYVHDNPIGKAEATENIDTAWSVVGRPHGRFTKLLAWVNS